MTHGATQIDQTTFGQQNDMFSIFHGESIHLRLDISLFGAILFQPLHINFTVEMTNVTHNGVIPHTLKVFSCDDVFTSSSGDENLDAIDTILCNLQKKNNYFSIFISYTSLEHWIKWRKILPREYYKYGLWPKSKENFLST